MSANMTRTKLKVLAVEAEELAKLTPSHPVEMPVFDKWSARLRGLMSALTSDGAHTPSESIKEPLPPAALGALIAGLRTLTAFARAYSASNREIVATALTQISVALQAGLGGAAGGGVFISFSHRNETLATLLFDALEEAGLNPFKSSHPVKGLAVGRGFYENILQALRRADALVFLATPESITESWPTFEAGALVGRDRPVLSVCVGTDIGSLPSPLVHLQAVHASDRGKVRHALAQVVDRTAAEVWIDHADVKLEAFLKTADPQRPPGDNVGKALTDYDPLGD